MAQAETVRVTDAGGTVKGEFKVEIADTPGEREIGLMNRKDVPMGTGMLFMFPRPMENMSFWMKNTLVPLDMLFADEKGRVFYIERDAKPLDLTSRGPKNSAFLTKFVLELPAGSVGAWKIGEGDMLAFVPNAR